MKRRFISKKKGFTLIELLGVIVVLAIITLITTPVITSIIDKAKREAFRNSTYGLVSAGTLYYTEQLLDGGFSKTKIFEISGSSWTTSDKLSVVGQLPSSGKIAVSTDGRVSIAIYDGKYCATKKFTDNDIALLDGLSQVDCLDKVETKTEYKESILNGADPELKSGMIPVVISDAGVVTVADVYDSANPWYRYGKKVGEEATANPNAKIWANVVLVDTATRNSILDSNGDVIASKIGTTLNESNILSYLVWIPRYAYTGPIADATYTASAGSPTYTEKSGLIGITFQNASTKTSNTHPAFTFGSNEVNGFWVGKYESGFDQSGVCGKVSGDTTAWTPEIAQGNNTTTNAACTGNGQWGDEAEKAEVNRLLVKPNIPSWRGINVKSMYDMSLALSSSSKFGLTVSDTDSHMMKNMEWGAVAYLSRSDYGKNAELNINNCSSYITGTGAAGPSDASSAATCRNVANDWKSANGKASSTTGNISGVYDMSGGAWEYVMGYSKFGGDAGKSSGFTQADMLKFVNHSTNAAGPDSRYIDLYDYETTQRTDSFTDYTKGKRGDATIEMGPFKQVAYGADGANYRSSWYGDYAQFVTSTVPWFVRGGMYNDKAGAGIFTFSHYNGGVGSYSFRVVVSPVAR